MKHSLRPKTLQAYEYLIRLHIKPGIGDIPLTKLKAEQLQSFYSDRLDYGLSSRSVEFIHAIIHSAIKQAVKWGMVVRNVSDLVEKPKVEHKAPVTWSVEQVKTFLDATKNHRYFPIYVLACATGMREGELLGIHFSDIDWGSGIINVRHSILALKGGLVIGEPKTEKAKRPIPLPAYAIEVLKSHCEGLKVNQELIFTTSTGKPISPRNLVRHFKSVIARTQLPDIRLHDLRHYHASYLLAQGINPKIVQERLGHSSIILTLNIYSHVIPSLQKEAAAKVNEMFK